MQEKQRLLYVHCIYMDSNLVYVIKRERSKERKKVCAVLKEIKSVKLS